MPERMKLLALGLGAIAIIGGSVTAALPAYANNPDPTAIDRSSVQISEAHVRPLSNQRTSRGVPGVVAPAAAQPGLAGSAAAQSVPAHGRRIDVSLSEQTLRLMDGNEVVFRSPIATGIAGAETPTGSFAVQYHMPKARFQGELPNGRTYDIPDVPWILAFSGDYTIHAAPWRTEFGQVGSNGCVTLPLDAARFVYDWAHDGTPIHIRN